MFYNMIFKESIPLTKFRKSLTKTSTDLNNFEGNKMLKID